MHTHKIAGLFLMALLFLLIPNATPAQIAVGVGISVHIGPPALPVYAQPICPAPGYIWTPGFWSYGPDGYFWVPGTWVMAPTPGFLWTPGYWGWGGGAYLWHAGYWGPHVGFYGGINYGFGYGGVGFVGGEWRGGAFHYNTAVTNVNTTVIHNSYVNKTVINNTTVNNNVSYNGGTGGINAKPTASEQAAANEHHVEATAEQTKHEQTARSDRSMLASENHGKPAVAATSKPGVFHGQGVVAARAAGTNNNRTGNNAANNHAESAHADRPPSASVNNTHANAAVQHANHPNATQATTNKPNNNRPNTSSSNNSHSNNSHPAKQSHPAPQHPHEGGHGGR